MAASQVGSIFQITVNPIAHSEGSGLSGLNLAVGIESGRTTEWRDFESRGHVVVESRPLRWKQANPNPTSMILARLIEWPDLDSREYVSILSGVFYDKYSIN